MIVCSCPLHDNRNGVDVCTCLCQEHDTFFDQGTVLVRKSMRTQSKRITALAKEVEDHSTHVDPTSPEVVRRIDALNERVETLWKSVNNLANTAETGQRTDQTLIDSILALKTGIESLIPSGKGTDIDQVMDILRRHEERLTTLDSQYSSWMPADPDFVRGIAASVDRLIDRVDALEDAVMPDTTALTARVEALEERLPLPVTGLSDASVRAMEENSRTKDLPPDKWDRFGARWTCVGRSRRDNDLLWRCDDGGRIFMGEELEERGPFTSKSPLAEDQPSDRERMIEKMAEIMSAVEHPHGSSKSRFGRSYTDRLAEAVYDLVLADRDVEVKEDSADDDPLRKYHEPHAPRDNCGPMCNHEGYEDDDDDEDSEWVNAHKFVPRADIKEKCEVCGGPADGVLHTRSGLWSGPWEPQIEPSDSESSPLFTAVWQAVHDAAVNVRDTEKERWLAAGLVRWIEHRYQLFDQPAYRATRIDQEKVDTANAPQETCGAWGGCDLPKGHNMGKPDIPEYHHVPRERESDGNMLARLGTDAVKWADRFVALFQGMMVGRDSQVDEGLMLPWFASAIGAGESKHAVELDYLAYLAGRHYPEKARDWFENYYGSDAYKPPGPDGLIADWAEKLSKTREALDELKKNFASPPEGWFTFGTHAAVEDVRLEFWGSDETYKPIFERPVTTNEVAPRQPREGENIG